MNPFWPAAPVMLRHALMASLALLLAGPTFAQTQKPPRVPLATVKTKANGGDAASQNEYGLRYVKGEDKLPQDFVEAAHWFRLAAEQGLPDGQHNLAALYFRGQGVPQDHHEAFKWYRKAADQGFAPAQSFLAWMHLNGKGVETSFQEAVKWYRRAAEQGDKEAQYGLGLLYLRGENLDPDYVEAYKWLNLSAAQGHANAIKQRARTGEAMTAEELAGARRRSSEFKPKKEAP